MSDTPSPSDEPDVTDQPGVKAAAPAGGGPSRRTLAIVAGAIVAALVIVAIVVATRPDDGTLASTSPVTLVPSTAGTSETGTAPLPTDPAVVPVESVPNTHPLPPAPFEVATPKKPGNLAIFDAPNQIPATRTLPNPVMIDGTPSATVPLVLLVREHSSVPGWIEVFLPVRPNGSTGFVLASDVNLSSHDYHIEITLSAFRLKAFKGDQVILDAPIATAAENTPTPGGLYYTNMLLKPPDPNTAYGTYAYGLSGYSDTLQTFNGGPGQLGIHGTNDPSKIGQSVSHGCIRLKNQDIEKLVPILPLGVPVQIFP